MEEVLREGLDRQSRVTGRHFSIAMDFPVGHGQGTHKPDCRIGWVQVGAGHPSRQRRQVTVTGVDVLRTRWEATTWGPTILLRYFTLLSMLSKNMSLPLLSLLLILLLSRPSNSAQGNYGPPTRVDPPTTTQP